MKHPGAERRRGGADLHQRERNEEGPRLDLGLDCGRQAVDLGAGPHQERSQTAAADLVGARGRGGEIRAEGAAALAGLGAVAQGGRRPRAGGPLGSPGRWATCRRHSRAMRRTWWPSPSRNRRAVSAPRGVVRPPTLAADAALRQRHAKQRSQEQLKNINMMLGTRTVFDEMRCVVVQPLLGFVCLGIRQWDRHVLVAQPWGHSHRAACVVLGAYAR